MRIHYLYNIPLLALLTGITACSSEESAKNPDLAKQAINLSVGVDAPVSRAVISDGEGKTLSVFEYATDIWMVMQSEYQASSGDNANPGDKDFQGDKTTTNCVSLGTTGNKTGADQNENVVNFSGDSKRYWDDAHGRSSALSIWAIAVPDVTGDASKWTGKTAKSWITTTEGKTIEWSVPAAQTAETVKNRDLCFSNNITKVSDSNDNRMKFSGSAFEQKKLIFYHALTKITIIMKEGDGFDNTVDTDFNLKSIALNGFKLSGTFDVAQGEFTSQASSATAITSMKATKTASDITLEALVMPGRTLSSTSNDAMVSFNLDDNRFSVSEATVLDQIQKGIGGGSDWTTFEAGKNYVITFTVNKTGVKVSATIAQWNTVTGDDHAPKINIMTSYGEEGDNFGKGFSFLRSLSLADGYTKDADVTYEASKYVMSPQLYWANHDTHYFFRGVWPLIGSATVGTNTVSDNVTNSAISVNNVAYAEGKYPSDLMIGYPRTTSEKCVHGNTVAEKGICATEGDIRMNFRYVMSQVEVNLKTNEAEGATNKVIFDSQTTVEILGGYTSGNILLQDGSASFTGKSTATYTMNREGESDIKYHDAIIPQSLENLKFRIVVRSNPDDTFLDSYETVLGIKNIKVVENGVEKNITAWEPGKKYVYTLTITKTGIKVTATIKDWIQATGSTEIWM